MTFDSREFDDLANRSVSAGSTVSWPAPETASGWRRGLSGLLLFVSACCCWMALPGPVARDVRRAMVPEAAAAVSAPELASPKLFRRTRPIEEIRVGQRVVARNPEITDAERDTWPAEPDWSTCQLVRLEMPREDGAVLHIDLLRPREWLKERQAAVANWIELDLPEMGASGPALVREIGPCPPIEPGSGKVVTATFRHPPATQVLNVTFTDSRADAAFTRAVATALEDASETIGVTDNHPFWSVDRQEFVPIGEMAVGERVVTYHGDTKRIASKLPRPGPQEVYNLEVYAEHVYFVGDSGVLAHNNCAYEKYADTYLDVTSRSKYTREDVLGAIEANHGVKLTDGDLKKMRAYYREQLGVTHLNASDVVSGYTGRGRVADLSNWALGGKTYTLDVSGVSYSGHFSKLNEAFGAAPSGFTWHHTHVKNQFQLVPTSIHNLSKSHLGVELWALQK